MTHVAPLAREAISDPELQALVDRGEQLGVPNDLFPRILAHSPLHAVPVLQALLMSHAEGNVDHRLKEVIRILLARFAGDRYFAALRSEKATAMGLDEARIEAGCGDYEESEVFTAAEKCALRYADQMFLDAAKIDGAFYADLKMHYSEAQIMELGAFIAFHYGMQMFMRSLAAAAPV